MLKLLLKIILLVLVGFCCYFLLTHHILFFGGSVKLLKKSRYTSEYTFLNASSAPVESLMRIDTLREAGLGDLLIEMKRLDSKKKKVLEQKYESDPIYY